MSAAGVEEILEEFPEDNHYKAKHRNTDSPN